MEDIISASTDEGRISSRGTNLKGAYDYNQPNIIRSTQHKLK